METAESPEWLTYEQAAERLQCSTKTIQRRVAAGRITAYLRGTEHSRWLRAADLEDLAAPKPAGVPQ